MIPFSAEPYGANSIGLSPPRRQGARAFAQWIGQVYSNNEPVLFTPLASQLFLDGHKPCTTILSEKRSGPDPALLPHSTGPAGEWAMA